MRNPLPFTSSRLVGPLLVTIIGVASTLFVHAHRPPGGLEPESTAVAAGEISVLPEPHYQILLATSVAVALAGAVLTTLEVREHKSEIERETGKKGGNRDEEFDPGV